MTTQRTTPHRSTGDIPSFWRSRWFLGFLMFAVASLYMLVTEHRAHYLSALPLILLLGCTVAHVLMRRGRAVDGQQPNRHGPETHHGEHK